MTAPSALPPGRVVVVGTLNTDFIWSVPVLPRSGETILATGSRREFGGKGANQAVAAVRQGARVTLIGAVGDDAEGRNYRAHLQREQIDEAGLTVVHGTATGSAQIFVDARAENLIVVHPGANGKLDPTQVAAALERVWPEAAVLVVQLECPLEAALAALRGAARHRVPAILNASPINAAFPWGAQMIDAVVVNEHECAACFGHSAADLRRIEPGARSALLRAKGVGQLIVTQGSAPTLRFTAGEVQSVPTHPVEPRDTVGAGDTFAGVLAARRAAGEDWPTAIRHANVTAALSTLAPGAQTAMPTRAAVEQAMAGFRPENSPAPDSRASNLIA